MKLTAPELHELIALGLGSHLQLVPELPDDDAVARTLCAFANTRGGWLVVGVDPESGAQGCPEPKRDMTRIRLVAEEDLKPPLNLALMSVRTDAGILIAVQVKTSDGRPHSIPGASRGQREIMVRVGAANHEAEGATLNALRSHRTQGQPGDALEFKIMAWITERELEFGSAAGDASPVLFGKSANVGLRRASKAFINLERSGLLIGCGGRSHRFYALP